RPITNAIMQRTSSWNVAAGNRLIGRTCASTSFPSATLFRSGSGLVTGVTAGTATIAATSEGVKGTSLVTVSNAPVATVTVAPATASILTNATVQLTATLKDAAGNILDGKSVV